MNQGRRRMVTDAQVARIKAWRSGDVPNLTRLAAEIGIHPGHLSRLRHALIDHKTPSPK